ncbi:MAG: DUF6198 family protein [Finegoldia sp.]|nr:DUF6198 family protein [Finegoldia sp.]
MKNTKNMKMYGKNKTLIKLALFLLGTFVNSLGIALITKANLGTSQISGISYVLSLKFENLSFGLITFLLNVVFLIMQIMILKSRTDLKIIAQLPVSFLLGFFVNISMGIFSFVDPNNFLAKVLFLLLGCTILGLGISIEVAPDIVKIPGEAIVFTIAREYKLDFGKVKVIFDIILVAIALVISLIAFGSVKGIGVGTLVSALLVGRIVNFFNGKLGNFYNKILS